MAVSDSTKNPLHDVEWRLVRTAPGECESPTHLQDRSPIGRATVPGTVAQALLKLDPDRSSLPADIDAFDWWYQCELQKPEGDGPVLLYVDGLATIAEIWINDTLVLTSRNMFVSHVLDVSDRLTDHNTISIAFRSVAHELGVRKPRGRWKTNLVESQQLRWIRTTLLGRIPGWTPPVQAVGPWRDLRLECGRYSILHKKIRPVVRQNQATVEIELHLTVSTDCQEDAAISFTINGQTYKLACRREQNRCIVSGALKIDDVERWWPHTEGTPQRYSYSIDAQSDGHSVRLLDGAIGFRSVSYTTDESTLSMIVNDAPVPFCRGFCWSNADILTLNGDRDSLKTSLMSARDAGANLIRIGGTMVYESDDFYDLCDELGLMVWQDFMFANMDYPGDDAQFSALVEQEIEQQTRRLCQYASVVTFCGNSEVEQQAAMFGQTEDAWKNSLFYEAIPGIIRKVASDIPYFPSSPSGGALPFHNRSGISHYFGVGAYKRPLSDIDTAGVLFTTECLGFSNISSPQSRREHFGSDSPVAHSPKWKAGVPRDSAAGWDFEDVRDHYLRQLYGHNAAELRYCDNKTYIAASTAVTGDVMEETFARWRHADNPCGGALIWFMKDLVPGAGWGFIDSDNRRKPLFYFLRRAWAANTVNLVDRGLDGLYASLRNDSKDAWTGILDVQMLQHARTPICKFSVEFELAAGAQDEISIDNEIGRFFDTTYSYRFGPPKHDVTVATVSTPTGEFLATAVHFPVGRALRESGSTNVEIHCEGANGQTSIRLISDTFLQCVELTARDYEFSDNYFHLAPNVEVRLIATRKEDSNRNFRGLLSALNLEHSVPFK